MSTGQRRSLSTRAAVVPANAPRVSRSCGPSTTKSAPTSCAVRATTCAALPIRIIVLGANAWRHCGARVRSFIRSMEDRRPSSRTLANVECGTACSRTNSASSWVASTPARSTAASLFNVKSVAHSIFMSIRSHWAIPRRLRRPGAPGRDELVRLYHVLDVQAAPATGHGPFDVVTRTKAEQCRTNGSEHRDTPLRDVRFIGENESEDAALAGVQIHDPHEAVDGDDAHRDLIARQHQRAIQFGLQLAQMVSVQDRCLAHSAKQASQPAQVLISHDDGVLTHLTSPSEQDRLVRDDPSGY